MSTSRCSTSEAASRVGTSVPYLGRDGQLSHSESPAQETPMMPTEEEQSRHDKVMQYELACNELGIVPSSYIERVLWNGWPEITMPSHGLGPKGTRALAVALVNNTDVRKLDLSDNNIEGVGAQALAQMLSVNVAIAELDLSGNNIDDNGIRSLCNAFEDKRELQKLSLSGNSLSKKGVEYIQYFIDNNIHVKELNLSNCSIDSDGASKLAPSIASNDTLLSLDLSWNMIRGSGAVAIAKSIKDNRGLLKLDISWNGFGYEGCQTLEESLKKNKTLLDLDLSANRVHAEGAACLFRALQKNTSLEVLKLNKNPLTAQAATMLIKAIGKMKHDVFKELQIEGVEVDDEFTDELALIRAHRNLTVRTGPVLSRRGRRTAHKDPDAKLDQSELLRSLLEGDGVSAMDVMLQKEFKAKSEEINRKMLEAQKRQEELLIEEELLKAKKNDTKQKANIVKITDNDNVVEKTESHDVKEDNLVNNQSLAKTTLTDELKNNPMYQVHG